MKKLNRFVSLGMVLAMLLCLLVPSASAINIAEESSNETDLSAYKDTTGTYWTKLPFDKELTVADGTNIPSGTSFTFSMTPATVPANTTVNNQPVTAGVALTNPTVTLTYDNDSKKAENVTDSNGYITNAVKGDDDIITITTTAFFTLPTYTKSGIYRYTVMEDTPTKKLSYVTYDSNAAFEVDVYVTGDADDLHVTSIIAKQNNDKNNIVFKNAIQTSSLQIKKVIDGNGASESDEFTFYIRIPVGGVDLNLVNGTKITGQVYEEGEDGNAKTVGDPITLTVQGNKDDALITYATDDAGVTTGTTKDVDTFKLKGGQWLQIDDLPVGMIFFVTEEMYTEQGYTTKFQYIAKNLENEEKSNISSDTDPYNANGTIYSGTNVLTFTNTKDITPGTGINLDVLPYVVVLAIALGGCVLFIFNKKRRTVR